jgi:hypothetical protein
VRAFPHLPPAAKSTWRPCQARICHPSVRLSPHRFLAQAHGVSAPLPMLSPTACLLLIDLRALLRQARPDRPGLRGEYIPGGCVMGLEAPSWHFMTCRTSVRRGAQERHSLAPLFAVVARCTKEVSARFKRPKSSTYRRAVSFKWLDGLILILGALHAYLVNHERLLDAALLFGIGVILV